MGNSSLSPWTQFPIFHEAYVKKVAKVERREERSVQKSVAVSANEDEHGCVFSHV